MATIGLPLPAAAFQGCPATIDLEDDVVGRLCPDKRLGVGIVVFDVVIDGALEVGHALENTPTNPVRVIS